MRSLAPATPSARPVADILRDLAIALARQQAGEDNAESQPGAVAGGQPKRQHEGSRGECESPSTAVSRPTCRTSGL